VFAGMPSRSSRRLDPFVPTSWDMVEKILDFAELGEDSLVVDLGSGDGRLVMRAAELYGSRSIGVELDPQLVEYARRVADSRRLRRVSFINADAMTINLAGVTHVLAYLTRGALKRIEPVLLTARPNAVIVTHNYPIPGWRPVEVLETRSASDGRLHTLYKYIPARSVPARPHRTQRLEREGPTSVTLGGLGLLQRLRGLPSREA